MTGRDTSWSYTDYAGDAIEIRAGLDVEPFAVIDCDPEGDTPSVHVPPAEIPAAARALYECAGLRVTVLTEQDLTVIKTALTERAELLERRVASSSGPLMAPVRAELRRSARHHDELAARLSYAVAGTAIQVTADGGEAQ